MMPMPTLKSELSKKNKYWISKHRYYELKHFCLQYPEWKKLYRETFSGVATSGELYLQRGNKEWADPTETAGVRRADYARAMKLIETCAKAADEQIWYYIFRAATENLSFTSLKTIYGIPCERDMYYDRYRRFFWLLHQEKGV